MYPGDEGRYGSTLGLKEGIIGPRCTLGVKEDMGVPWGCVKEWKVGNVCECGDTVRERCV